MLISLKWKTDAANKAFALPSLMPSKKCSNFPTPPLAIRGIFKNSDYKPEGISSDVFMLKIKTKLSNENKIGLRK